MAYRLCAAPGCPLVVTHGRCPQHTAAQDHARGSAQSRGYDSRWSRYSKAWLALHPHCGERQDDQIHVLHSRCAQQGRLTAATCTDHILPMSRGGSQYDPANNQSLCRPCNTAKGDR